MADSKKRLKKTSRNPSASADEFDWDKYDKETSGSAPARSRGTNSLRPAGGSVGEHSSQRSVPDSEGQVKRKKKRRKKKVLTEKQRRFRKRLRLTIASVFFIGIVVAVGIFMGMYSAVKREISEMHIRSLATNTTSIIYYLDENGQEQELTQLQSDTNRIWVDSTQIPQIMKDAMVAIEDERFYKHHGVDVKRTVGATGRWVLSKFGIGSADYGGSTITQQVIKNITNEKDNTPSRKVKEMMRAIALEEELTKDEILTLYLNIAYFANNCSGVEAAARTYFNKSAADLTLAEAASIAGITQFPSEYDPIRNPQKNIEKRNLVLDKMRELEYITEAEYTEAKTSDLVVNNTYTENLGRMTSYFEDQIVTDVINDLVEQRGYSQDFAKQQVYNGGLKIIATVDPDIQSIMEDVFYDTSNFPSTGMGAQSAMVVIDPYTGRIKGLVGGLGEKTNVLGWNRATQMKRQPGSSIKPLSVYAPAIDTGKVTEVTNVRDEEIEIGDDKWKPKNSYRSFLGDMPVKEAVARSANIPAVKVLDLVGVPTSVSYLQGKFHISSIIDEDKNYSSLALGGLTEGVSVKEMAAAYGTFVNSGKYIKPHTYTLVYYDGDREHPLLSNNSESTQAISAGAAYVMTDMLKDVVEKSYGTATAAELDNMPTYGKTGTTDDDCDKWFVGFTPYYTAACWYGFDSPSSLSAAGVSGNPAVRAWNRVMERIHKGLNPKEITKPSSVVEATICTLSGKLPTSSCPEATGYLVEGTVPRDYCDESHASSYHESSHESSESISTPEPTSFIQTPEPTYTPTVTETPSYESESSYGSESPYSGSSSYYDDDDDSSGSSYDDDADGSSYDSDSYEDSSDEEEVTDEESHG